MDIDKNKACFITGPRPKNLFDSYDPYLESNKRLLLKLREVIIDHIENEGIDTFIIGMALGIDLWAGRIIIKLREQEKYRNIKLIGAIPCKNHSGRWKKEGKEEWQKVYDECDIAYLVSDRAYFDGCMQIRNEWMVDHAKYGIGVFSGSPGGTYNCLIYAKKKNAEVTIIGPSSLKVQKGI